VGQAWTAQQAGDAPQQPLRSPNGGQRRLGGAKPLDLQAGQGAGIVPRVAAELHREVVAAVLALLAHAGRDPSAIRMEEEQDVEDMLQTFTR